jgi:hydroxymethylbilane synthase
MQSKRLKLGTRGSALALAQSEWVAARIRENHPEIDLEIVRIVTGGDRSQATNTPLSSYSEKGIFAKEIELALLKGEIDIAVHSMKDLAAQLPDRLVIASVPTREDVRDVIVGRKLGSLPNGARVGTSSARRGALLAEIRPDLTLLEIRGNIDTRISKLENGDYDSIVLAAAGLSRLGRKNVIAEYLDPLTFVPDPGQGALAIEIHVDNADAYSAVQALNDPVSYACVSAERAFLRALGGGCSTPVGAWARLIDLGSAEQRLIMTVMHADSARRISRATIEGEFHRPEELGLKAAGGFKAG